MTNGLENGLRAVVAMAVALGLLITAACGGDGKDNSAPRDLKFVAIDSHPVDEDGGSVTQDENLWCSPATDWTSADRVLLASSDNGLRRLAVPQAVTSEGSGKYRTALTGSREFVLLAGCTYGGGPEQPAASMSSSPSRSVQIVSDETVCDLLFRRNGRMSEATALLSRSQTQYGYAAKARRYASELDDIAARAEGDMSAKIQAVSRALRAYSSWIESPSGSFNGRDFAAAGLELGHTCGL